MKKRSKKIGLRRETLKTLTARQVAGAAEAAVIDPVGSADPCKSCLCVSEPQSVCLCSGGGRVENA
jgi:hypothetical protein